MKKKKLLARVTALTLTAILMVPSSIGTTVLASPDNTEASAEAPGSDGASDKAEGTVQESASADKSADGGQTPESQDKKSDTDVEQSSEQSGQSDEGKSDAKDSKETAKAESYKVSIEDPENGLIAFPVSEDEVVKANMENPQKALEEALKQEQKKSKKFEEGSEVQVSIAPDSGYYLVSAELLDKEGKKIHDLEVSEEGTAAFTMPESEAKITASFEAYTDEQLDEMDEEGSAAFEEELTDEEIAQIEANSGGSANEAAVCSDDSNVSAQSARIAGSKSIYLNVPGSSVRYGSYTTRYYTTNENQYAYCMNPVWKTPKAGWYTGYLIDNDVVRKAFYYAYGGPGYSSFVNSYGWIWDGSQQYEYAYTHIMLSYMYALYVLHDTGRANNAFHGVSSSVKNHIKNKATQITWMASAPAGYGCYYFDTSYINGNRRAQPMAFQVMNASTVQFRKSSSISTITNGNSCYSLEGAQYSIYSDAGCTNRVATLSTDGNGNTGTATLDTGTYYYKETQAPEGYELNQSVGSFYLGNCDTKVVSVSDEPVNDPSAIQITKKDKVTGDIAEGGTTMAGAQFTVSYYAGFYDQDTLPSKATRTWVVETKEKTSKNGKVYVAGLTDSYKVGGDSFYYTGTIPTIPRGTITIQETKAPEGYRNDLEMTDVQGNSSKNGVYLAQIRNEGDLTKLMGSQTFEGQDSYARSDIKLLKVNGVNDNPIANVPFKITNTRTGESHTVYTDENGIFDSSNLVNTKDTNSDQAGAGVWFGDMAQLSDDQGAFEYGDYTIEEVSGAANKGMVMYTGSFTVNGNSAAVVDLGKIVNTSIEVSTTSYGSESETNRIQFDHKAPYYDMGVYKGEYATVLCDDINVKGLTSGYIVSKLVDKETGDFVKDENGSDLQATGKLIEYNDAAAGYTGTGSITMPVKDVSNMLGKDYVFFTYIYELKSDGTPNYDNLLVSHTDMNDSQETVSFQNITTELTDSSTGLHDLQTNGKTVTLKDKIDLHNFPSYDEINFYYIKYEGTLMDASGNPVTDSSGNPVKSTIACHQITKDELENGTSLTYDLSADVMKKYAGQKLTSYVQVYFSYTDPSVYENYIEWAAEKDLSNKDQTVSIPAITNTYVSTDNVAYTDKGISDEVDMIGLIPGNVYTIEGKIVDKTTGKVISSTRECTYGKDEYDITKVEPSKDSNYELVKAAPYTIYHLKNAVSYEGSKAEGYYRLSDDGSIYVLCTESGQILNEEGINKNKFEQEILYPGRTFKEVRELTATTTFTAGAETANKLVNFNLDPESLAGKSYVITEDLYFSHKGSLSDAEIDPAGTTVYAVLYDDGTLDFQKRKDTYASKVVTEIYRFEESDVFGSMEETPWYLNRNKVKTVSFRDKVSPQSTAFWFGGMEYLTQINLDKLDTRNTTDMQGMFGLCKGLKTVNLSSLDTSNVTDMNAMFYKCSNLTSLDLSHFKTDKVTDMNSMFTNCSGLTSLNISGLNTSSVTNMQYMFHGCSGLKSLQVDNFDTSNVTNMKYMFYGCEALTSLNVSGFDTSKVTDMRGMLCNLRNVKTFDVSHWDTSNVEIMEGLFRACISLTNLDVSHFNTSRVTDMNWMFDGDTSLTSLDVSHWDTSSVIYMGDMFNGCDKLASLDVSGWNTGKVENFRGTFGNCKVLTTLDVSHWDTSSVKNMQYMFYGCSKLSTLDVSKWNTANVTDMQYMFRNCESLTILDVSNFNTSSVTNMRFMFSNCRVSKLQVNNFNTSKVTDMQDMFGNNGALTSLNVSNFDTSNVTNMQGMFYYCSAIKTLDLSNFDTSKVTNMQSMFDGCKNLTSVNVSNFDTSKVTSFGNLFCDCGSITMLDLSSFDTSKVEIMQGMFARSYYLKTIYVSDLWSLKSVTDNGRWMFDNCTNLRGQSGNAYNGATSNMSTANYQTGYLTNGSYTLLKGTEFRKTIPRSTENIVFTDEAAPSGVAIKDVSAAKNGRVVSWSEGTTYKVSTQKKGKKVIANEDSSFLFSAMDIGLDDGQTYEGSDIDGYRFLITSLDMSNLDTSRVKSMNSIFEGNVKLTSIDVSNFNTSNVEDMSYAFSTRSEVEDENLIEILGLGKFDTSNVKYMRQIFAFDDKLENVDVRNWDTKNVQDMSSMFNACYALSELDLSDWNTRNVQDMSEMFGWCKSIKKIYVGDNWNTDKVTSSTDMFAYCSNLVGQSGTIYDSTKTDVSMANYQSGYLTYKAASQKLSSNDVAKAVPDDTIPLSSLSLTSSDTSDTEKTKETNEKQEKESVLDKVMDLLGLQSETGKAQAVAYVETPNTPALLYQHDDLNDVNETFYVPEIESTSLVNTEGEHFYAPASGTTLTDHVAMKGLKPGMTYVLTGQLMDKDTQEPAKDASGNVITATQEFTPTSGEWTADVTFSFDASNLGGKTLVAFETLNAYPKVYGTTGSMKTLSVHKDINDAAQTVTNMGISTTAKDKVSGSKLLTVAKTSAIVDSVSYKGAVAGNKYRLQAVLMDKLTGEAAVDGDGQPITGSKDFTASATSGSVDVELTFQGTGMAGGEYVVYEQLYLVKDNGSTELWASHEDMNDEDQLVNVPGITTQLVDAATNTQFVKASSSVNAVDTVYYEGLIPGQSYTLTGQLIEKATGKVFVDGNGKEMTVTKTFTPAEKSGEVDVEFTLNATNLNTSSLVAYETLSLNGKEIVSEKSLDNEYQTLSFPVITSTKAADKRSGTKVIDAQDDMTIVDTISYTGMQTGLPLTVRSTVMDKATGKAAKDSDGNDIIVESEILPDETNGSIDVEIPIKGRNLMGKTLVVYEEICYADGVVIAQHKDLKDAGQTVTVAGITTTAAIQTTAGQNDRYTSQTVRDTVKYYGLTKGTSYTLQGTLMDKATGNTYQENGKDVTASKTFKASATSGTETLDFEISSSEAKNKTLVVCENVYTTVDGKQVLVAQHSDLTDKDQTVEVPDETVGKLKVTKTIQNGNKNKAFKFTITLKGSRIKDSMMLSGVTFTNGVGTISLKHGESKLIEDIPSGTTYSVVEEQSGLYRPIMTTGDAGTIEDGKTAEASFVNIHLKEEEPGEDEVNITVFKKVLPSNATVNGSNLFASITPDTLSETTVNGTSATFTSSTSGNAFNAVQVQLCDASHEYIKGITTSKVGITSTNYTHTNDSGYYSICVKANGSTKDSRMYYKMYLEKGKTYHISYQVNTLTSTKATVSDLCMTGDKFMVTAVFSKLKANTSYGLSNETEFKSDANGNATVSFLIGKDESVTFLHMPVGCTYRFTEAAGAYTSSYAVTDAAGLQKIATASGANKEEDQEISTATETADKGEKVTVTFTNEFQMSQDLTLTKKTVNADGSSYSAEEAFSFTVKFTGLPANAVISSTAGDISADAGGNAAKTISLKNGEQVIFHELPVGSKYQITESGSEYRPSYSIDAATVVKKTDRIVKRNSSLSTQIETIDKGENDVVTFTNERIVWYALPNTGSYMLVILIGTALIMLMIASRKRKDYLSEK